MRMEAPAIDRVIRYMATHTQVRIPALPMPDHTRAVDIPVVITAVDIPVVITAADITAAITAADITVTKKSGVVRRKGHSA